MNRYIGLVFLTLVLASCSKEKNVQKKLVGDWSVVRYEYRNAQGLSYFYDVQGEMAFSEFENSECGYTLSITYTKDSTVFNRIEDGNFDFIDHEYYFLKRNNPNGTISTFKDGRILTITSTDVKLEFIDEQGMHGFILEK